MFQASVTLRPGKSVFDRSFGIQNEFSMSCNPILQLTPRPRPLPRFPVCSLFINRPKLASFRQNATSHSPLRRPIHPPAIGFVPSTAKPLYLQFLSPQIGFVREIIVPPGQLALFRATDPPAIGFVPSAAKPLYLQLLSSKIGFVREIAMLGMNWRATPTGGLPFPTLAARFVAGGNA